MKTLQELMSLKNKTALVTGGAGYLGHAICESLAELNANVIVASRHKDKCDQFAEELKTQFSINAVGIDLDICEPQSIKKCVEFVGERFGSLDVLINNAWSGNKNSFESISDTDWNYDINVCLNGVFHMTKAIFPIMKKPGGIILNVASMYGHVAPDHRLYDGNRYSNPPSYGAAKAGVIQLSKYLASFLSPHGIRVNAISPGPFPFPSTIKENPEFVERLKGKNMLGRLGEPEDLKGVVALLCSGASSYITGQNFCIDGGWAAW